MKGWPPASVWMLAAALVLPPLVFTVGRATGLLVTKFGIDLVISAGLLAGGLAAAQSAIRGRRLCYGLSYWIIGVYLFGALGWFEALRHPAMRPRMLPIAAGGTTMTAFLAGLLWWPETRRWCGLLPPAGPEDDG